MVPDTGPLKLAGPASNRSASPWSGRQDSAVRQSITAPRPRREAGGFAPVPGGRRLVDDPHSGLLSLARRRSSARVLGLAPRSRGRLPRLHLEGKIAELLLSFSFYRASAVGGSERQPR